MNAVYNQYIEGVIHVATELDESESLNEIGLENILLVCKKRKHDIRFSGIFFKRYK